MMNARSMLGGNSRLIGTESQNRFAIAILAASASLLPGHGGSRCHAELPRGRTYQGTFYFSRSTRPFALHTETNASSFATARGHSTFTRSTHHSRCTTSRCMGRVSERSTAATWQAASLHLEAPGQRTPTRRWRCYTRSHEQIGHHASQRLHASCEQIELPEGGESLMVSSYLGGTAA